MARFTKRNCLNCNRFFMARTDWVFRGAGNFCSHSCAASFRNRGRKYSPETLKKIRESHLGQGVGPANPNWKGGKQKAGENGEYVAIYNPSHPSSGKMKHVLEHRLAMERKLGRLLKPYEVVHHINGIKTDNRPDNLIAMNQRDHAKLHNSER